MFAGLFVVLAGIEKTSLEDRSCQPGRRSSSGQRVSVERSRDVFSNLVSNVPAVLLFKPFVEHLADPSARG